MKIRNGNVLKNLIVGDDWIKLKLQFNVFGCRPLSMEGKFSFFKGHENFIFMEYQTEMTITW